MTRKALFLLVVVILSVIPFASLTAQEPLIESVCFVTDIGKLNDGTFNQNTYVGLTRAAEEFGLDTTYIETQAQTDYEANLNTCISEGYDAILTVGFLTSLMGEQLLYRSGVEIDHAGLVRLRGFLADGVADEHQCVAHGQA